jgi:hypothetical protein
MQVLNTLHVLYPPRVGVVPLLLMLLQFVKDEESVRELHVELWKKIMHIM